MAPDYGIYLAENVLNEQKIVSHCVLHIITANADPSNQVSYRILSRAVGVHVNQAKRYVMPFSLDRPSVTL